MAVSENFDGIMIKLASSEEIKEWSKGEITIPDTVNYRTGKPKEGGLFCEKIFGPVKNYECSCGKFKGIRYKGIVCDKCGVEVTSSRVRRENMGHIALNSPVVHIWYYKATPSVIGSLLNLSSREIEKIINYVKYVVLDVNDKQKDNIVKTLDRDYHNKLKEIEDLFDKEVLGLEEKKLSKSDYKKEYESLLLLKNENLDTIKKEYSDLKSRLKTLVTGSTIHEKDYRNIYFRYQGAFNFASGVSALKSMLSAIDIRTSIKDLIEELRNTKGKKRDDLFKRLKILVGFYTSGTKPEHVIIDNLPVIPSDLRPIVQLEGGKFASSDINIFYRRVLMRNIRLKKMIDAGMPEVVKRNEIRLLQESVNNLLVGEKNQATGTGSGVKLYKSLTDILVGKEGRFRKNLLGKRVDYSGRSVITVGPDLRLDECGVPLYIAIRIFTPFIIAEIFKLGYASTPKQAEKLIKEEHPIVLKILRKVIKDKYVLLNRAPTLHRLGIQGFKVKLMPGKTIRIHPLVCSAFNADFDGDQMGLHLPISAKSQQEVKEFIASDKNILKPGSGEHVISLTQDLILGIYYLTDKLENSTIKGYFKSMEDVLKSYNDGYLKLRDCIILLYNGESLETTVGRVILNDILPEEMRFLNEHIKKKQLKRLLEDVYEVAGREKTVQVADTLKDYGFKYATQSATTLSAYDFIIPNEKHELIKSGDEKVKVVHDFWYKGIITDHEKHHQIITIWNDIKVKVEEGLKKYYKTGNNLHYFIDSGAKGNRGQLTQMAGMKGLVSNPKGEVIELPIKSSSVEGFESLEYFIAAHSARKGKADTAIKTAESGYLTRKLVDANQDIIIREEDCGTDQFLLLTKEEMEQKRTTLFDESFGRILAEDLKDINGNILIKSGEMIEKKDAHIFTENEIDYIKVRSPITCNTSSGVCQKCFGMDLGNRQIVKIGTPVGIISSQSIGEPGTQLTMRTFHSGGVASSDGDITQGIKRIEQLFEFRTPKNPAIVAPFDGKSSVYSSGNYVKLKIVGDIQKDTLLIKPGYSIVVKEGEMLKKGTEFAVKGKSKLKVDFPCKVIEIQKDKVIIGIQDIAEYDIHNNTNIKIKDGEKVYKGQVLTSGVIDLRNYRDIVGDLETQKYIIDEIKKVYVSQGQDLNNKYVELVIKNLFSRIYIEEVGDSNFIPGDVEKYEDFMKVSKQLQAEGKQPPKGERLLIGLTTLAKSSESWLSSASFQETMRILVSNSIKGSIDTLDDLKANVILGKKLPIGENFKKHNFTK